MSEERNKDRLPFQLMCLSDYAQELTVVCLVLRDLSWDHETVGAGKHRG